MVRGNSSLVKEMPHRRSWTLALGHLTTKGWVSIVIIWFSKTESFFPADGYKKEVDNIAANR
jgi:hypothetical protein